MGNPKFIEPSSKCKFKKPPKQLRLKRDNLLDGDIRFNKNKLLEFVKE